MKIALIIILFDFGCLYSSAQAYDKDKDIQEALIAVSRKISRECPIVLIYDEEMPELSVSQILMKRMQQHGRMFMVVNLSTHKLSDLEKIYGTNNPSEILQKLLHTLYRKRHCYTFHVWVKDPRILYPGVVDSKYHPGWRQTDMVMLLAHHITKRYKSLISLQFWRHIPNIIGLKRSKEDIKEATRINIFTVLPYFNNGKRKPHEIDVWLVPEKRFLHNNTLFFDKFTNFHKAPVILGILWKEPFFIWGNKDDPYLDGLDWRLFQLCQEHLNFTLNVANLNATGRNVGNNSWSGILGQLENGSIDVGSGGISITAERLQFFDFCRTYYTDSYNFIAPLSRVSNTALHTFLDPLSEEVWIAVFMSAFIGLITLKFVAMLENRYLTTDFKQTGFPPDPHFTSFFNNIGFFVTIFCQKPYFHLPHTFAVQSVFHGLSLTMFLLGMAFSSCLISVLLSYKPAPIADKVDDILKTNLQISIRNYDGHLNEYMENSKSLLMREIYKRANHVDYYQSFDAMDSVVKGQHIYIDSKAKIHFSGKYLYSGTDGLKFHISSGAILEFANLGWPVIKNWPVTSKIDKIISRTVEGGLVQYWMSQFMKGKFGRAKEAWEIPTGVFNLTEKQMRTQEIDPSQDAINGQFTPLSTTHISGVIVVYFMGIFLALFSFTFECFAGLAEAIGKCLVHKYHHHHQKPNTDKCLLKDVYPASDNYIKATANMQLKPIIDTVDKSTDNIICKKSWLLNRSQKNHPTQFPELVWSDFNSQ